MHVDPEGSQKYWEDGLPATGVKTVADIGSQKYWEDGLPGEFIFPAGSSAGDAAHGGFAMLGIGS